MRVTEGLTELASFVYDGQGRRVQKTAGSVTTTYIYDGEDIVEERLSTSDKYRYVHDPGIDQPLARVDATTGTVAAYYLADHLGSIVQETDATGAVSLTREYDPWGNLIQGRTTGGYAYTAREWDPEIGLYYYRARCHDPKIGRFISEDPIRFAGGRNFYAYAGNRPTNSTDPLGLAETPAKPPGATYEPPKRPWYWWIVAGTPRHQNPCPDGYEPKSHETGPNPQADYAGWRDWKNEFIDACNALGPEWVASCPPEGRNNLRGTGQVGYCVCCKEECGEQGGSE